LYHYRSKERLTVVVDGGGIVDIIVESFVDLGIYLTEN
jgi:hypothetical protein